MNENNEFKNAWQFCDGPNRSSQSLPLKCDINEINF